MLKIIIKSIILVCIILSIYFIVNPSACSNLINGRAVNVRQELPTFVPEDEQNELFTPTGDKPLRATEKPGKTAPVTIDGQAFQSQAVQPASNDAQPLMGVTDTNSLKAHPAQPTAADTLAQRPQAEEDYAIAKRYVELENQYLAQHKDARNAAKDISYIVMDDFELTPAEWEAFLQRATASNLFETVRQQQATK